MTDYASTQPQDQEDPGGASVYQAMNTKLLALLIVFLMFATPIVAVTHVGFDNQIQTEHTVKQPL